MNKFRFKQFEITQAHSAMKIGTDAVLLGAWCNHRDATFNVLDIGAGTGILSLITAQRLTEHTGHFDIEAIEIEENAYEECVTNFDNSPWSESLFCYHASLIEFAQEMEEEYDLILCNPPFYKEYEDQEITPRSLARSAEFMPLPHIFAAAEKLCSPQTGEIAIILPYEQQAEALQIAKMHKFYPYRILKVKGTPDGSFKRVLLQFQQSESKPDLQELIIETKRHQYTSEYREWVKDFYIKM